MATSVIIVPNGRLYKGDIVLYGEFAELAQDHRAGAVSTEHLSGYKKD